MTLSRTRLTASFKMNETTIRVMLMNKYRELLLTKMTGPERLRLGIVEREIEAGVSAGTRNHKAGYFSDPTEATARRNKQIKHSNRKPRNRKEIAR